MANGSGAAAGVIVFVALATIAGIALLVNRLRQRNEQSQP